MTDLYGIVIWSKDGYVILDERSMVQSWGNTMIDNIDFYTPVLLRFKFPDNTKELMDFRLSITYDMFRTYSGSAKAEPLAVSTGGDHTHLVATDTGGPNMVQDYNHWVITTTTNAGHSHGLKYDFLAHEDALRDHEHYRTTSESTTTEGDHQHSIDNHGHPLLWGIHTAGYSSLTVDIYVNQVAYMYDVGPEESFDIPITEDFLNVPGWNDIQVYSSTGLSRVNATYFTQIYLEV